MIFGELVRRLHLIADRGADPESNHAEADALLLQYISEQAGDNGATVAFERVRKWYA